MKNKTFSAKYYTGLIKIIVIYIFISILCFKFKEHHYYEEFDAWKILKGYLEYDGAQYGWYINYYIGLFLVIPFINLAFNGCKTNGQKFFLTAITLLLTIVARSFFLGFKEGEVLESSMITKQVERAQKKVEENNFGIRKRLLEYDDVMNKQRTVVYSKRRHALMGERIGMDISNTIWDRVVNIIDTNDYEGCKEQFIKVFAMEVPFTSEEFINKDHETLCEEVFQVAMGNFKRKMEHVQETAMPVIKQVYENQGAMYERIVVPLTDGRKMYNIPCNLKEAYDTECKSVVKEFEKQILLHIIDEAWKENLRALDELKHSVQNASYEQKDPLLIFKLESVKLFDNMVNIMNNRSVSILMRAQIPVMQQVQEASPEEHTQRQQYTESKQSLTQEQMTDPNQAAAAAQDTRAQQQQPRTPIIKDKLPGRNDPCPCGSGKKFKQCHGRGLV